jgi:hypothetical protein
MPPLWGCVDRREEDRGKRTRHRQCDWVRNSATLGLGRQVQKLFRGQASQECENQSFSLGLAVRIAGVSAVRSSG